MPIQRIPWEGHPFGEESLGPSEEEGLASPLRLQEKNSTLR